VLAEHFHHAPGGRQNSSFGTVAASHWRLVAFEEGFQAIGERLVGAKHAEVPLLAVQLRHIAQEAPEHMRVADAAHAGEGTASA